MAEQQNKVKYNICNVHYAELTESSDGTVTYGTPVHLPGAVSLSLDPKGDSSTFYADGYAYYATFSNAGYEGDLEVALIPDHFRINILQEAIDSNKVLIENINVESKRFALLFEFDGDVKKIRHVFYNCSVSRPTIEGKTREESIDIEAEKLEITASPLASGIVKAKTGVDTTEATYNNWYKAVYQPNAEVMD